MFDGVADLFDQVEQKVSSKHVKDIPKNCDSNLNNIIKLNDDRIRYKPCTVVLNNIDHLKSLNGKELRKSLDTLDAALRHQYNQSNDTSLDSENDLMEFEESDSPLPPLYLLRDEGSDKWVLLSDLCNILKVKSKEAVLKQVIVL